MRTCNSIRGFVHPSIGPSAQVEKKRENEIFGSFLFADMQLYKRLCLLVHRSVGPLVCWSVEVIESKSGKKSVLDVFWVCVLVGGAWGVDGGWMPLPTCPQRYCDPASLVIIIISRH